MQRRDFFQKAMAAAGSIAGAAVATTAVSQAIASRLTMPSGSFSMSMFTVPAIAKATNGTQAMRRIQPSEPAPDALPEERYRVRPSRTTAT